MFYAAVDPQSLFCRLVMQVVLKSKFTQRCMFLSIVFCNYGDTKLFRIGMILNVIVQMDFDN